MLNREQALERLRAGGRLSLASRPQNVITAELLASTVARDVKHILNLDTRATGPRCLAPSANQPVLP